MLAELATGAPVILHLDDLQWGEPMLLDALRSIVALSSGASLLVLVTARPELLEDHPDWGNGANASTLRLEPLRSDEAEHLLELIGAAPAPRCAAGLSGRAKGTRCFSRRWSDSRASGARLRCRRRSRRCWRLGWNG